MGIRTVAAVKEKRAKEREREKERKEERQPGTSEPCTRRSTLRSKATRGGGRL